MRKDSVDYVLHQGDHISEYTPESDLGRKPLPDPEIYSLHDYRKRIATYRTDQELLASHAKFA